MFRKLTGKRLADAIDMRYARLIIVLALVFGLHGIALARTTPEYLLCFREWLGRFSVFYLMKFDPSGRVLMKPREIAKELRHVTSYSSFALTPGKLNGLVLWSARSDTSLLYRVEIDKRTLQTKRIATTRIRGLNDIVRILATNRQNSPNFLVLNDLAIELNPDGTLGTRRWQMVDAVNPDNPLHISSLSPDGSGILLGQWNRLFYQKLDAFGVPLGRPVLVGYRNGNDRPQTGVVSNRLPGGRRVLATRRIRQTSHDCGSERTLTQVLDARSGKPLTDKHVIAVDDTECNLAPVMVLDPHGNFVLYLHSSLRFGHNHVEGFAFQALDALANSSGSPRPLTIVDDAWAVGGLAFLEDH